MDNMLLTTDTILIISALAGIIGIYVNMANNKRQNEAKVAEAAKQAALTQAKLEDLGKKIDDYDRERSRSYDFEKKLALTEQAISTINDRLDKLSATIENAVTLIRDIKGS